MADNKQREKNGAIYVLHRISFYSKNILYKISNGPKMMEEALVHLGTAAAEDSTDFNKASTSKSCTA